MTKQCTGPCERILDLSHFDLSKSGKCGRASKCKQCRHEYRLTKKDEIKVYNKKYNSDNSEKIKELKKQYRESNKDKIREYHKDYCRNRQHTDIKFKIENNIRKRMAKLINRNQKSGSAIKDLGCSLEELKQHLEKQFYPNPETGEIMSWENYGLYGWHIDHIKPLTAFNLTKRKEFLKACNYINLQPLWAKENIRKGNKI